MLKIGIYGGSFDPLHFGHLNVACELLERHGLDEVWFVPAHTNPHKTEKPPASFEHRLKMLQLGIDPALPFKIKDIEGLRTPPSYTVHTVRAFVEEAALSTLPYQFYLLLGEDSLPSFFRWHLPEEIIALVPLLVASRSGQWEIHHPECSAKIKEAIKKGLTQTRLMDISSSDVRDRIAKQLYCGHLVPAPILDYIYQNHLY